MELKQLTDRHKSLKILIYTSEEFKHMSEAEQNLLKIELKEIEEDINKTKSKT